MRWSLLFLLLMAPVALAAAPQDAERFAHLAGFNLAELPSFEEIANKLGWSPIQQTGDASNADSRVCYRSADRSAVVEFFHGEVDWGYVIRRPHRGDEGCPQATALAASSLSVAGVFLGMEKRRYLAVTGKSRSDKSGRLQKEYSYVHVLSDAEVDKEIRESIQNGYPHPDREDLRRWDVDISISAEFADERLVRFAVDRTETN